MSAVEYAVEEGVAVLTLNKPKVNAYDLEFTRAVRAAVDRASDDQSVGAVIVKSALERVFCVGADINAWQANDVDANQRLVFEARGVADAIVASKKVFIAVISGHALGGGLELAMACDIRFAAEGEYSLGLPEVKLGLMPGNGGTQRLMRLVGPSIALELIVSGEGISPERAVHLGLVNRLMPRQRVLDESFTFARSLARGPRIATAAIKESIRAGMDLSMDDGLRLEVRLADALYDTPDGIEGFAAYVDKREPIFGA